MVEVEDRPLGGRLLVLGGGGHAGVVLDTLRTMDSALLENAALLDPNLTDQAHGLPVIGGDDFLENACREGFGCFVLGLGGGTENNKRQGLFDRAKACGLTPVSVIHASAEVSPSADLGEGVVIFARAVVNAHSKVGENVILNTASVIEHDCQIADHVHIAPRACLLGGVVAGDRAFVGAGSIVRQGLSIGADAVVGCGAVVIKDVPPGATVYGNPAV